MAQLGRLEFTVQDVAGAPVAGASISIRRQGATIQSGGPTVFVVDDPGAMQVGYEVQINGAGTTGTVAAAGVAETGVTLNGPGLSGSVNNDRLVITATNSPPMYRDAQGNEAETNPLTTNSLGYAACWLLGGKYDVVITGPGITTRVIYDVVAVGGESLVSNVFDSATAVAYSYDTLRTLSTAGSLLARWRTGGVTKFSLDRNGGFAASGASSVAGALTVSTGGLAVTGNSTITGTLGGLTGLTVVSGGAVITAGGLTVSANGAAITGNSTIVGSLSSLTGITMTSGNFDTTGATSGLRCARITTDRGSAWSASNFTLTGWGSDAVKGTPSASADGPRDTRGRLTWTSGTVGITADPTITLTFADGAYANTANGLATVARVSGTTATYATWLQSASTTTITFQVIGITPAASTAYGMSYIIID